MLILRRLDSLKTEKRQKSEHVFLHPTASETVVENTPLEWCLTSCDQAVPLHARCCLWLFSCLLIGLICSRGDDATFFVENYPLKKYCCTKITRNLKRVASMERFLFFRAQVCDTTGVMFKRSEYWIIYCESLLLHQTKYKLCPLKRQNLTKKMNDKERDANIIK